MMGSVEIGPLDRADVLELRKALTGRMMVGSRARVLAAFLDVRLAQHEAREAAAFGAEVEALPVFVPDGPRAAHGAVPVPARRSWARWL